MSQRPQLDLISTSEVVDLILDVDERAVPAVRAQSGQVAAAAMQLADALERGGRVVFVGAGTSGRLAWAEAAELPGTFGLDPHRVVTRLAGGLQANDGAEDVLTSIDSDSADLNPGDVVVAVAASGSTPYTVELAAAAKARGATVIAIVTVNGSALAALADVAIEAVVGPEVLRGSTRLAAGSAQKVALNALTTAAMARLGRVHGDLMVDVVAANAKLRERAAAVVAEIAGCDIATSRAAMEACSGDARTAVVHVVTGLSPAEAAERVHAHRTLREALQ